LEKTDGHGIPAEACRALANAALAALTMDGVPVNLPSVTGASGQRLLGQFTPGSERQLGPLPGVDGLDSRRRCK